MLQRTAEGVCCNNLRTWAHGQVFRAMSEIGKCHEFIGDYLDSNKLANKKKILSRHPDEKCYWVANIAHNQL